jgi:hypothetical protein
MSAVSSDHLNPACISYSGAAITPRHPLRFAHDRQGVSREAHVRAATGRIAGAGSCVAAVPWSDQVEAHLSLAQAGVWPRPGRPEPAVPAERLAGLAEPGQPRVRQHGQQAAGVSAVGARHDRGLQPQPQAGGLHGSARLCHRDACAVEVLKGRTWESAVAAARPRPSAPAGPRSLAAPRRTRLRTRLPSARRTLRARPSSPPAGAASPFPLSGRAGRQAPMAGIVHQINHFWN